jgi:hypothetical protein
MAKPSATVFLIAGLLMAGVVRADPDTEALRERIELAVLEWLESVGGGARTDLSLSLPEQTVPDVGIIFDGTWEPGSDGEGLRVLGVRPGAAGARMGLKPGDRIVAVNGIDLRHLGDAGDGRARAAQALSAWIASQAPGDSLSLRVVRDGREIELVGAVHVHHLPAIHLALGASALAAAADPAGSASTRHCGEISSFALPPRGRDLFPVMIVGIDGSEWLRHDRTQWRLPAGTYRVRVVELISDSRLRVPDRQRGVSKTLEIEVAADMSYELAARLIPERRFSGARGDYWEPVVWRVAPKECRRVDLVPRAGGRD